MQPLISVVIPTYNRAYDLARALRSVIAQTYSCWEVLVIDNYSNDATDDVVRSCNDLRIKLFKIHNCGVIAASRNLGVELAEGKYIAFLDSDDWWKSYKLEESLKYLEQGADIVYHDLFLATKSNQRFFWRKARTRKLKKPVFDDLINNGNALNNSSVVVRRKLLNKINGFSEDRGLITAEDYDAWLRAANVTERFVRIPKTLGYYWVGGGNLSSSKHMLETLDTITNNYANTIGESSECQASSWLNYVKGKTYYRLGSYELAKKHFKLAFSQSSYDIQFKSLCMLVLLKIWKLFCPSSKF